MVKLNYWNIYERVMYMNSKNYMYINTEKLNTTNFPSAIKNNILNALFNNQKIIIVTDSIYSNELENIFKSYSEYLIKTINNNNLIFKIYDSNNFNIEYPLQIIDEICNENNKIFILWDVKNLVKKNKNLEKMIGVSKKIIEKCNEKNIINMVYMDNYKYELELFTEICSEFESLTIYDRGKEITFDRKEDFYKAAYLLQSYTELKYQNKNLLLFNETMANIPMNFHKDEFKNNVISKLRDLCNLDFCCVYTSDKKDENVIFIDSYYGITKKHKYYLINDLGYVKLQRKYNQEIMDTGKTIYIDTNKIKNDKIRNQLLKMDVISAIGVSVDYYETIKGVIWVGRYKSNEESLQNDVNYVESICKTVFYLIQEQQQFFNLQNKFVENEKLRAMGEMATGIAHDINNILTPIIGSVQILKNDYGEDINILKQLKTIEMCAYDVTNIINKIKKFTKNYNHNSDLEIFNINEVIIDAIGLTKNKWLTESILDGVKINVITNLKSKLKVQGNLTELREVFINIISNAVDSIELGGKIEISTLDLKENIIIEIKDNGMGMNEEIKKRIFEPFFTTKGNKGSGLGLSICYKIIESSGGNIEIESEENVGTTFKIKLPICKLKNQINNEKQENKLMDFSANILVIDDKEDVRNILSQMIKCISKCKVKVSNGTNIKRIEEELKRRNYDIVISDFSMPNVNGLEVAEKVKKTNKDTYFCLMTGWIGELDKEKMMNVDMILNKPISKERIEEVFIEYKNK